MYYRKLVKWLRKFRTWHRFIGTGLGIFVLITASTGILLGWKKNIDILQPADTNLLGWGLLVLAFSGFWLWYGPKMIRKIKMR